jgi:hypothetical protein
LRPRDVSIESSSLNSDDADVRTTSAPAEFGEELSVKAPSSFEHED